MTIFIGLMGPAGSGKSTVSRYLVERYGAKQYTLAAPLKEIAKRTLRFTDEQLYGSQESKERVDERYGFSSRQFLQWLGTEGIRGVLGEDFWVEHMIRQIEKDNPVLVICDDVRFKNEVYRLKDWRSGHKHERDVWIWRLESPWRLSSADPTHQSEAEWSKAPYDELLKFESPGLDEMHALVDSVCMRYNLFPLASEAVPEEGCFLDEIVAERTAQNPEFPALVEEAKASRK